MIHPWKTNLPLLGDPGKFLYLNFHKLHHASYNPGPFSGLSMHPVEHFFLLYSYNSSPIVGSTSYAFLIYEIPCRYSPYRRT
jgi:sterol desaturase/sphingolipid hydroxylase (fatty acid hydroxylase superfamily)